MTDKKIKQRIEEWRERQRRWPTLSFSGEAANHHYECITEMVERQVEQEIKRLQHLLLKK